MSRCYERGEKAYKLNNDVRDSQLSAPGGYISFVAHLWVGENGKLIRGTIEDVHTGKQLALDLSEVVAFLQASLAYSPGQGQHLHPGSDEDPNEELPSEGLGEDLSDTDVQDGRARDPQDGGEGNI